MEHTKLQPRITSRQVMTPPTTVMKVCTRTISHSTGKMRPLEARSRYHHIERARWSFPEASRGHRDDWSLANRLLAGCKWTDWPIDKSERSRPSIKRGMQSATCVIMSNQLSVHSRRYCSSVRVPCPPELDCLIKLHKIIRSESAFTRA